MARGSIKQRSPGSWYIRVELEPDPVTGRRRQKSETFVGPKRRADERLAELLGEAQQGIAGQAGRTTVAEYLDRWLADYAQPNTAPMTHVRYGILLRRHVAPLIGAVQLEKLRSTHILQMHAGLRDAPLGRGRKGTLSALTRRHVHRVLHTALEHAVKWRLIAVNPAGAVDAPTAAPAEMRTFDAAQAAAFLRGAEAEGTRWHAYFRVALTTGLRQAELAGLRWQDVDLEARTLAVRQTIQNVQGVGLVTKPPKTPKS
jgi:integrase